MSLDLYIKRSMTKEERLLEKFDDLSNLLPDDGNCPEEEIKIWGMNITHNLSTMAKHVPCGGGKTLYDCLWNPEMFDYYVVDSDYKDRIHEGLEFLVKRKPDLLQYNPANGWGDYSDLVKLVKSLDYLLQNLPIETTDYKIYAWG